MESKLLRIVRAFNLSLLALCAASNASASDGVAEINDTCAVQTGCFAGDAAGYPVTITGAAGPSYRLTSDLLLPDENTDGIIISVGAISIDLNGFAITRAPCLTGFFACTPGQGTGSGIESTSTVNRGLSVSHGSVTGMGASGIALGDQAEVFDVIARWNRLVGISAGAGSILVDNTAHENGFDGLSAGVGSVVSRNNTNGNGQRGLSVGNGSSVRSNSARNNVLPGISTGTGSSVVANTTFDSDGDGFATGDGSAVSENASLAHGDDGFMIGAGSTFIGNNASSNGGDGVESAGNNNLQRNAAHSNTAFGFRLMADDAYRDNVITSNGSSVGTAVNLFGNSCNGTTSCP